MEITLADIADMIGGELKGDPGKRISGVAPIEVASPDDITFAGDAKFLKKAKNAKAGRLSFLRILKANPAIRFVWRTLKLPLPSF